MNQYIIRINNPFINILNAIEIVNREEEEMQMAIQLSLEEQ